MFMSLGKELVGVFWLPVGFDKVVGQGNPGLENGRLDAGD